jgi:hypothetical protein
VGFFQDEDGAANCKACVKGTFQTASNQIDCSSCPLGYFQNRTNHTMCYKCGCDAPEGAGRGKGDVCGDKAEGAVCSFVADWGVWEISGNCVSGACERGERRRLVGLVSPRVFESAYGVSLIPSLQSF